MNCPIDIGAKQRAKVCFGFSDGHGIGDVSSGKFIGLPVKCINREVSGTWVIHQNGGSRIVALFPVGQIFLLGVKDFDTVVEAMSVPDMGVKKKIWSIVKGKVVVGRKEIEKKNTASLGEVDEV
jgi:hypothetical protein